MPKKKSRNLADIDPIERLKIQQRLEEWDMNQIQKLPKATYTQRSEYYGGPSADYQGPQGFAGPGTLDRMPGTNGYTFVTPQPSFVDNLLDLLRIKKKPNPTPYRKQLTPTPRPNPMPGII